VADILDRWADLEAVVASLPITPANLGHNGPPQEIGLPPYGEEEARGIEAAIEETRAELAEGAPDPVELERLSSRFEFWGAKIGKWLASKADLAVDEAIKSSIKAVTWASALGLLGEIAARLLKLAKDLSR
jgi:hypothetical protein